MGILRHSLSWLFSCMLAAVVTAMAQAPHAESPANTAPQLIENPFRLSPKTADPPAPVPPTPVNGASASGRAPANTATTTVAKEPVEVAPAAASAVETLTKE